MNAFDYGSNLFGIGMPGPSELVLILVIVLVIFGHNRIPQLGEALGKGIRNFKKSFAKDETEAEATQVEVRQVTETEASTVSEAAKQTEKNEVS